MYLCRCMRRYLEQFNEESVQDELSRVSSQLSTMSPRIPPPWKLLANNPATVTRQNLLEVADHVRTWLDDTASREAALEANSKKV